MNNGTKKSAEQRGEEARENIARQQREHRREWRGKVEAANWGTVSSDLIGSAISHVSDNDGAIQFGYSRDGGSYAVRLLGWGEPRTEYVRPSEDVSLYLQWIIDNFPVLRGDKFNG